MPWHSRLHPKNKFVADHKFGIPIQNTDPWLKTWIQKSRIRARPTRPRLAASLSLPLSTSSLSHKLNGVHIFSFNDIKIWLFKTFVSCWCYRFHSLGRSLTYSCCYIMYSVYLHKDHTLLLFIILDTTVYRVVRIMWAIMCEFVASGVLP